MSRTLEALRRIEARGLPLSSPREHFDQVPIIRPVEEMVAESLQLAEAAVGLAIDEYAYVAHRPIPALDWSEIVPATSVAPPLEVDELPDFTPEADPVRPAAAAIVLDRGVGNFETYRALRSRLLARQPRTGGSVFLLAATNSAVRRSFSAAALAIALAELELGEVLLVNGRGFSVDNRSGDQWNLPENWQEQLFPTTEPQVKVLPAGPEFLTSAALGEVCLWDCLRRRFRFTLLGPWLASDSALSRLATGHDGALLLMSWNDSQRAVRRALRHLTAGGSRVLGSVVIA